MIETVQNKDNVLLLALGGTLDVGKQAYLKEELVKKIPSESTHLVLDFKKVDFIDSACLGALISIARRLRSKGGDVRLASLHDEVKSIFQITRLDKVFKIFEKPEDAIKSYSS